MQLLRLFLAKLMKGCITVSVQTRRLLNTHGLQYTNRLTDHCRHNRGHDNCNQDQDCRDFLCFQFFPCKS